MTNAKEKIEKLCDEKSFVELYRFLGENREKTDIVCGYGTIENRPVYLYIQNGAMYKSDIKKVCNILDMAAKNGAPIVEIINSSEVCIEEGMSVISAIGELINKKVEISGVIPQISCVMGNCIGTFAYELAMSDFVFVNKEKSKIATATYRMMKTEDISENDFANASFSSSTSGIAHFICDDEDKCIDQIRELITFLPDNNLTDPDVKEIEDLNRKSVKLNDILSKEYNVKEIIKEVVDDGHFFEVHKSFAESIIIGFARLAGRTVGIVANNGQINIDSADKASRFIRFCDSFNISVVTFIDCKGFETDIKQEESGLIRHGARLFYAYSESTVPKISVILNKAYGTAFLAMGCMADDITLAWPDAQISIISPCAAASVIYSKEIGDINDREKKTQEYLKDIANPYIAAKFGCIEDIIKPENTRQRIINALENFAGKRENRPVKKHGNMVL